MTANSWPGLMIDAEQDTLYIANNTFVYALNLSNGTEKWRYPAEADNKVTFFAPPSFTSDQQLILPSYDTNLYSLNPETKAVTWTFPEAKNRYIASALVMEDQIVAANSDNSLYSLDLSGQLLWTFETGHSLWGKPATDGEIVYLPSMDHHVYALQADSGAVVWETDDLGGALVAQPVLGEDGILYIGTFGSEIVALDTKRQGQIVWRTPTNGWVWSSVLLQDGVLYFGDLSGSLFALDAATGSEKWKFAATDVQKPAISGTPAILGDTLYYVTEGGSIFALDWSNGGQKWSKQFDANFYPGPMIVDDTIYLASMGGDELVIALDANGNQKWEFIPAK